jgi:hypothetical protein
VEIGLQRDELRALYGREKGCEVTLLTSKQVRALPLQTDHLIEQRSRGRLVRGIPRRDLTPQRATHVHLTLHELTPLRLIPAVHLCQLPRLLR